MINDSMWNLLLGMVGIFAVMGVIFIALTILNKVKPGEKKDDPE